MCWHRRKTMLNQSINQSSVNCTTTVDSCLTYTNTRVSNAVELPLLRPHEIRWFSVCVCQNTTMAELKTRVEELRLENDYQLRLKDMTYNEKIKELTDKFIQEMESLKTKNQASTSSSS